MESDVQKIINRIIQDAKEKAESLIMEAQKSSEMLLENRRQSARQKAEEDGISLLKRAENEAKLIRGSVITDAKLKADWMVLSEKERLITSVLDEVRSRLKALSKSEYIRILEKMIIDAGTVLGGGELEVMLNEDDSTLPLKLNALAEAIAKKTGVQTRLKLSKQKIEAQGAIIKTVDGKIVVDNTFEAILKRREKELRFKIAKILFRS